ncbi:MAG: hypothetical protein WEB00_04080 [Dehalococcoidia bacterium]
MGFYHGPSDPGRSRKPAWYSEFVAILIAVFSVLFMPLAILFGFVIWLVLTFVAFSTHWALGLVALGVMGAAIAVFAYWDSHRPPQIQS